MYIDCADCEFLDIGTTLMSDGSYKNHVICRYSPAHMVPTLERRSAIPLCHYPRRHRHLTLLGIITKAGKMHEFISK